MLLSSNIEVLWVVLSFCVVIFYVRYDILMDQIFSGYVDFSSERFLVDFSAS